MSNQVNSMNKGLTVKDLVTTGIFTALVFVFVLVGGIFFAPNLVLTFFTPAGSGLLAGPVFLLMIANIRIVFVKMKVAGEYFQRAPPAACRPAPSTPPRTAWAGRRTG